MSSLDHNQHDDVPNNDIAPNCNNMNRRTALLGASSLLATSSLWSNPCLANAAASTTDTIPEWTLDNGVQFPVLALNTVGLTLEDTERAVRYAQQNWPVGSSGRLHVDFHPGPKERDGVAAYIRQEGRNGLFLNTKIRKAPPGTTPQEAAERTRQQIEDDLAALNLKSVDMLMLRDSPDCEVIQAQWAVLEDALKTGKTRSVGVINFCESALKCVLETATITPAVNYYMLHVGMGRNAHGLRSFGDSRGIRTFAYGAVGEPGPNGALLTNSAITKLAKKYNKSPEAIALKWVLQTGAAVSVRPTLNFDLGYGACTETNGCEDGLISRGNSFAWSLTDKDMATLDALTSPDDNPTLFSSAGCPGAFVMPK